MTSDAIALNVTGIRSEYGLEGEMPKANGIDWSAAGISCSAASPGRALFHDM
ncbi:MAG: hypothetical protein HY048_09280 [Acidobacteria bacterium]|nr:hypothetical protein [Acidobacteriota bacterium]